MKLMDIPKNTKVKILGKWYKFFHLDGMYSYCEDLKGNIIHFSFWTPIQKVGDKF